VYWYIRHPQHPKLYLRVGLSLKGYSLAARGEPLQRSDEFGQPFLLKLPDGEMQRLYVEAVPFDYVPVLRIDGAEILVAPPLGIAEKVVILLPLASALVAGALRTHNGLVPGLLGSLAAALVLRSGLSRAFRIAWAGTLALAAGLIAASWSLPVSWADFKRALGIRTFPVWETLQQLPAPPLSASWPAASVNDASQRLAPAMVFHLRDLLIAGELDSLEALFSKWSAEAERDVGYETRLYDAFDAFQSVGPEFEGALDLWIEDRPGSWNARLARANYLVRTAYRQRGAKRSRDTPRSNFKAMRTTLQAALLDLSTAIRLNPLAIAAYWFAIEAATKYGDGRGAILALNRALRVSPLSFFTRARALLALTPRWAGSYSIMEMVAAVPDTLVAENPELGLLPGFVPMDKGEIAWLARDTLLALRLLDEAMAVGPTYWFCLERGTVLYKLDQNEKALRDLDCAVTLRPSSSEARHYRSRTLYDIAHQQYPTNWHELFGRAEAEGDLAFRLDSLDKTIRKHRQFLAEQRRKTTGTRAR
jgi:tetratricopeptide (TPR) repeat protein